MFSRVAVAEGYMCTHYSHGNISHGEKPEDIMEKIEKKKKRKKYIKIRVWYSHPECFIWRQKHLPSTAEWLSLGDIVRLLQTWIKAAAHVSLTEHQLASFAPKDLHKAGICRILSVHQNSLGTSYVYFFSIPPIKEPLLHCIILL